MSMHITLETGTGKAKCKLCGQRILKGQVCIFATNKYDASSHAHASAEDCIVLGARLTRYANENIKKLEVDER